MRPKSEAAAEQVVTDEVQAGVIRAIYTAIGPPEGTRQADESKPGCPAGQGNGEVPARVLAKPGSAVRALPF